MEPQDAAVATAPPAGAAKLRRDVVRTGWGLLALGVTVAGLGVVVVCLVVAWENMATVPGMVLKWRYAIACGFVRGLGLLVIAGAGLTGYGGVLLARRSERGRALAVLGLRTAMLAWAAAAMTLPALIVGARLASDHRLPPLGGTGLVLLWAAAVTAGLWWTVRWLRRPHVWAVYNDSEVREH